MQSNRWTHTKAQSAAVDVTSREDVERSWNSRAEGGMDAASGRSAAGAADIYVHYKLSWSFVEGNERFCHFLGYVIFGKA